MNATITLDVIGTALTGTTFNIYQDVDLYTTPVASNVASTTLASGYSVTLDDNTKTVRILSNGACGNYQDIPVNRGDTSPSVVNQYTTNLVTANYKSITGNGKSEIFVGGGSNVWFSTDNGDTFTTYNLLSGPLSTLTPDYETIRFLHDGTNLYVFFTVNDDATLHVYRVTNYNTGNGFDDAVYTEVLSQTIGNDYFPDIVYYKNKAYYVSVRNTSADPGALYRTADLSTNFVEVLSPSAGIISSLDNYGRTVFCTVDYAFSGATNMGGVYRSQDNGLNWSQVLEGVDIVSIEVESSSRHIITIQDTSSPYVCFKFTENGGSTYTNVSIVQAYGTHDGCFVKKYKSVYFYQARPSAPSSTSYYLQYIPDIYAPTPLGQVLVGSVMTNAVTSTYADQCVLLQRNSLIFLNGAGMYSYLIEETI